MAIWFLLNTVSVGTNLIIAGTQIDDAQEDATSIRAAGGLLVASTYPTVAAAALLAQSMHARGADITTIDAVMSAAFQGQEEPEILQPVADVTALAAIPVAARKDGTECVVLSDYSTAKFAANSTEPASDTCIVPTVGTGRWIFNGGTRWGIPMTNRLRMLGAPAAIVAGDYFTIGGVLFEARAVTPPAGGTAGRIWFYAGANSAASRANAIKAMNGVVDAANVTYNGVTPPNFLAAAGIFTGDIIIQSATAPGGTPCASATATACTDNLTTMTDIWDQATCYGGVLPVKPNLACETITPAAGHIAKGSIEFKFTFTPRCAFIWNHNRAQNEAWSIVGNSVSLVCAGGGSPNNQPADVIDCLAVS